MGRIAWITGMVLLGGIFCSSGARKESDLDNFRAVHTGLRPELVQRVRDGFTAYSERRALPAARLLEHPEILRLHDGLVSFKLGRIYASMRSNRAALRMYSAAVTQLSAVYKNHPYRWKVHMNQGNLYYRLEQLTNALDSYRAGILLRPEEKDFFKLAGLVSYRLKRYAGAASYLERGNRNDFETVFYLTAVYKELQQWEKGFSAAQKSALLRPESREAHVNVGLFAIRQAQEQFVLKDYRKSLNLFLIARSAFLKAIKLLAKKDPQFRFLHTRYGEYLQHIDMKIKMLQKKLAGAG